MTDYEKLIAMFNKANISYHTNTSIVHHNGEVLLPKKGKTITVEAGYVGFISVFEFDKEENLLTVGAYE